jgi:outer membrane lipoprotein carrier protein
MRTASFAAFVAIVCAALPTLAQSALARLEHFLNEVQTLDAAFTQRVYDEKGELVQESSGSVQLARPERFRWEYEKPDRQLILADGEKLWIYDPELEQATVKSLKDALGAAPIALLTGQRPLPEQFRIEPAGVHNGLQWVVLTAKAQDIEFNRIRLGLDQDGVAQMELHDQFGQRTVISLHNVRTNIEIDPDRFKFEPPAGTDVINAAP